MFYYCVCRYILTKFVHFKIYIIDALLTVVCRYRDTELDLKNLHTETDAQVIFLWRPLYPIDIRSRATRGTLHLECDCPWRQRHVLTEKSVCCWRVVNDLWLKVMEHRVTNNNTIQALSLPYRNDKIECCMFHTRFKIIGDVVIVASYWLTVVNTIRL